MSPALVAILLSALSLGGCLTTERKEYRFTVKPDGSGSGTFTFYNLMSAEEDDRNLSARDYSQLVSNFLKGKRFEDQWPALGNIRKRLYEKDGKLNAEITFDFLAYQDVGLYRRHDVGEWMYYPRNGAGPMAERYDSSNGEYGGEQMPVVFWSENTSEFRINISVDEESPKNHSLLPYFKRGGTE